MKQQYDVLTKHNEWLQDYVGSTYSKKLILKLQSGLMEEHLKKLDIITDARKKVIAFSHNPKTNEILSISGSHLLKMKFGKWKGKILENIINQNLGSTWGNFISGGGFFPITTTASLQFTQDPYSAPIGTGASFFARFSTDTSLSKTMVNLTGLAGANEGGNIVLSSQSFNGSFQVQFNAVVAEM